MQTYIQSGNIIAKSSLSSLEIEELVHEVIRNNSGGDITVLARTPDRELLEALLSTDFSPDQIIYQDNTIYTLYATKYSDSKFNNNYFERKLKVATTTRNINTIAKLVALATAQ